MRAAVLYSLLAVVTCNFSANAAMTEKQFASTYEIDTSSNCFGILVRMSQVNEDLNTRYSEVDANDPIYMFNNEKAHMAIQARLKAFGQTAKELTDSKTALAFGDEVQRDIKQALSSHKVDFFPRCQMAWLEIGGRCKGFKDNQELLEVCFRSKMAESELPQLMSLACGKDELDRRIKGL